jgi:NlpC/P60 family putative phage cell wall peptidase
MYTANAAPGVKGVIVGGAIVVEAARTWIGTPFHLGAAVKGAGADCYGLLLGVWREVTGGDVPAPAWQYGSDWAALPAFTSQFKEHLSNIAVPVEDVAPGDIVVFGLGPDKWLHGGIDLGDGTFCHALAEAPARVLTSRFEARPWAGRMVARWRFRVL